MLSEYEVVGIGAIALLAVKEMGGIIKTAVMKKERRDNGNGKSSHLSCSEHSGLMQKIDSNKELIIEKLDSLADKFDSKFLSVESKIECIEEKIMKKLNGGK